MTSADMDVQAYLSRIGFRGPAEPTLEVLRSLHTCHQMSVPFENLTAHSGGRVQLALPLLYDKIVKQRRGGFCYENNGLFSWLLRQLGFQVTLLSAQVKSLKTNTYGHPFDHLTLMVSLDGRRWLCDVGFGVRGFTAPMSLETGEPQVMGHRVFRFREHMGMIILEWQHDENKGVDGDWKDVYKFTLEPRVMEDFAEMCIFHQTSPHSLFFCKTVCMMFTPAGSLTYIGHKLTSTKFPPVGTQAGVETTTRELKDEEIEGVLAEQFGIVLKSPLIPKDETVTPSPITY